MVKIGCLVHRWSQDLHVGTIDGADSTREGLRGVSEFFASRCSLPTCFRKLHNKPEEIVLDCSSDRTQTAAHRGLAHADEEILANIPLIFPCGVELEGAQDLVNMNMVIGQ